MAKVNLVRDHKFTFLQARQLAQSWIVDSEQQYDLQGEYTEGETQDSIVFSRKGLSGVLTVTETQFEMELTLGFLFSAYQKKIVEKINENMDEQLLGLKAVKIPRHRTKKINPAKLLNSKWTAVKPMNKEKHFLVSEMKFEEDGSVISCKLEAVMSKNEYPIDWTELKNPDNWVQGWK